MPKPIELPDDDCEDRTTMGVFSEPCVACEGTGRSTSGRECFPCHGTGERPAGGEG